MRISFLRGFLAVVLLTVFLVGNLVAAEADLPAFTPDSNDSRSEIPDIYKWDLSPLFSSDEKWDEARLEVLASIPGLAEFEGRLKDPASLDACLDLYFQLHSKANFVTLYANLRQSTALADEKTGAMVQRSLAAMDRADELGRLYSPRGADALPEESLAAAYAAEPELAEYRPYLDNLRRRAGRLLSPDAERALALLGDNLWAEIDLNEIPSPLEDTFGALLTDIPWPQITDEER